MVDGCAGCLWDIRKRYENGLRATYPGYQPAEPVARPRPPHMCDRPSLNMMLCHTIPRAVNTFRIASRIDGCTPNKEALKRCLAMALDELEMES